jgi:hypothetical protein
LNTDSPRLLLAGLAALLAANAGWSFTYIYADTQNTVPLRWSYSTTTVPIRILLGTDRTLSDGSNFSTSAQAAAQTWNTVLGTIQFQPTIASGTPADHNHVNELAFAADAFGQAFDSLTLAVTTTWTNGPRRVEGDIIFNSGKTWDSYAGLLRSPTYDLHRVAIHELGHVLGLDHPDQATPPQNVVAVMNSRISSLDTLAMDDINGAENLYGPPGPPANDNFAAATAISGPGATGTVTVTGFNSLSTVETGEPTHASNATTLGHTVWWKWTAPASGAVTVDTAGSYFDTTMGVYTGTSVASLATLGTNDDVPNAAGSTTHNTWSTVSFTATTGITYYIAVNGYDNDGGGAETGGIILNLTFAPSGGTLATITAQPLGQTVTAGTNVTFNVTATAGTSTISYQWQFNGAPISGATNPSFSLSSVTSANAGSYTVVLTTSAGQVTSNPATLTVNAAPPPPPPAPAPSSGGGGGGGAPSLWFLLALGATGLARMFRRR